MAATDNTKPALVSLTLPTTIDVRQGVVLPLVTAKASDAGSGVDHVVVTLDHNYSAGDSFTPSFVLDGRADTFADGASTQSFAVHPDTPSGSYNIAHVDVYDKAGNMATYTTGQLASLGISTNVNVLSEVASDTTAPVLTGLSLPADINVARGDIGGFFLVSASDAGSGIDRVRILLDRSYESDRFLTSNIVIDGSNGNSFDDGSSGVFKRFDSDTSAGTYTVKLVAVYDSAGNSSAYTTSQLAALGLNTSFTVTSQTPPDPTAPVLTALTVPTTIDVSHGSVEAAFGASATDTGAGVAYVALSLDHGYQDSFGLNYGVFIQEDADDDFSDGSARSDTQFRGDSAPGTYGITSATVYDKAGNTTRYTASQLAALGANTSFTVVDNSIHDITKPVLTGLSLPSATISATGSTSITLHAAATDAGTGVNNITLTLNNVIDIATGVGNTLGFTGTAATFANGTVADTVTFGASATPGTYFIESAIVTDAAGNSQEYAGADLNRLGIAGNFTLFASGQIDTTKPTLTALTLPTTIDVGQGQASASFTVGATDGGTGVDHALIHLAKLDASGHSAYEQYVTVGDMIDTFADGRSTATSVFGADTPPGTYTVSDVTVYDKAGNATRYYTDQLKAMGLGTSLTVTPASAVISAPTSVQEGVDGTVDLGLIVHNSATYQGTVTVSVDPSSTATNGVDMIAPVGSTALSFDQTGTADYRIDLGSLTILRDHLVEGTETIALRVTATGLTFANGTDTTIVDIAIKDAVHPRGAVAGDYDGDGRSDIVWQNANGDVSAWRFTGSGPRDTVMENSYYAAVDRSWHVVEHFDMNGDGQADILWRNDNGSVSVWTGNADGGFRQSAYNEGHVDTGWKIAATGDLDGDGKDDVLWRNADGSLSVWSSTGSGFAQNSYAHGPVSQDWQVSGVGDFDGDGKGDILWHNVGGAVSIWSGTAIGFAERGVFAQVDPSWQVEGLGDFNGDGRDDILWRNANGSLAVWHGTQAGFDQGPVIASVPGEWHVAQVGDFNGDGMADLLWRNTSGATSVWHGTSGGFDQNTYFDASVDNGWTITAHDYLL